MKYSTTNLHGYGFPLPVPTKLIVEYRPGGALADYAESFYAQDEAAVDEVVRIKGWDSRPGYVPRDVWVDGAF